MIICMDGESLSSTGVNRFEQFEMVGEVIALELAGVPQVSFRTPYSLVWGRFFRRAEFA